MFAVRQQYEFGRTYVVKPKEKHLATVVWLHGLGDNGLRYALPVPLTILNQIFMIMIKGTSHWEIGNHRNFVEALY